MLRPKALDHVGLIVTDMERSLRFYVEGLGLELLRRSMPDSGGASSAVLRVGGQEINVFCRPDLVTAGSSEPHRIDHFCLEMANATVRYYGANPCKQKGRASRSPPLLREAIG